MSPDTLPAPHPITRDTQALQPPPPPLIPSHPAGLLGQCHSVAMIPELLVRGGDDGEVEREMRWGILITIGSLASFFSSFIYISSFVYFWQLTAEAGPRIINFLSTVHEEQKHFNQITDRTSLSPASHSWSPFYEDPTALSVQRLQLFNPITVMHMSADMKGLGGRQEHSSSSTVLNPRYR